MIYLDNAATTKISDVAIARMEPYLNDMYGNPSGVYNMGRMARETVEEARRALQKQSIATQKIYFLLQGVQSRTTGYWTMPGIKAVIS